MYGDPFGEVVCRYWGLKGETINDWESCWNLADAKI